jgi:hypothetical protein
MEERQGMPYFSCSSAARSTGMVVGFLDTFSMDRSIRVAEDKLNSLGGRHVLFLTTTRSVGLLQLGHPKADDDIMAECDRRTTSRARIISLWLGMILAKCTDCDCRSSLFNIEKDYKV